MPHKKGHKEWTPSEVEKFKRTHDVAGDADRDSLSFSEWFRAERKHRPNANTGMWRGKEYSLATKDELSKQKKIAPVKKKGGKMYEYKKGGKVRNMFKEQYD